MIVDAAAPPHVAVPIPGEGGPFGTLCVYSAEPDAFDPAEQELLIKLADTLGHGIQALRSNVQQDISTSISSANTAMSQIANLNTQLQGMSSTDPSSATLQDQRDTAINTLSQLPRLSVLTPALRIRGGQSQ